MEEPVTVRALLMGQSIEFFVNDQYAFTRTAYDLAEGKLGLQVAKGSVTLEMLSFKQLPPKYASLHGRQSSQQGNLPAKGKTLMALPNLTTPWSKPRIGLRTTGGELNINSLNLYSMRSIWNSKKQGID